MSKLRAKNQKSGPATDRGQRGQCAAAGAARGAQEEPLKRAVFSRPYGRGRARTLGQGLPLAPLSPDAYKYPLDFQSKGYVEFSFVFIPCCSLGQFSLG